MTNTHNTNIINSEKELMQYLLNKYNNNLTLVSSTDYVLSTSYNNFIPYSAHDSQDIQEFMSEFSTDENDFYIESASYICNGYRYSVTSIYLDDDIVMFAGSEKDIIYHLHLVIAEEELNIKYKDVADNKLINNLIDQRIDEIITSNTPDANISLSERTATLV